MLFLENNTILLLEPKTCPVRSASCSTGRRCIQWGFSRRVRLAHPLPVQRNAELELASERRSQWRTQRHLARPSGGLLACRTPIEPETRPFEWGYTIRRAQAERREEDGDDYGAESNQFTRRQEQRLAGENGEAGICIIVHADAKRSLPASRPSRTGWADGWMDGRAE